MKHVLAILIGALLGLVAQASRDLDRMPPWGAQLLASFNRGDASDMSWAKRTASKGSGATFASRALDLNGTANGWVTYPDATELEVLPLTVVCWLYIDSYTGAKSVVAKTTTATIYRGWHMVLFPGYLSRGIQFSIVDSADTVVSAPELRSSYTASSALTAGAWYHVAATVSSLASHPVIYINGAAASITNEGTGASMTTIANTEAVRLGLNGGPEGGFWTYFDGKIDGLIIANRVWTAAEIAANYASGRP